MPVEGVEDFLGGVPSGARVPQPETRHPVRVDVLGGALKLGEDGEFVSRILGVRVRYLEQYGVVALNDEGAESHNWPFYPGSLRIGRV
ncbi:hypothetical protein GCM10009692_09940 [Leucobacter aridicollis]